MSELRQGKRGLNRREFLFGLAGAVIAGADTLEALGKTSETELRERAEKRKAIYREMESKIQERQLEKKVQEIRDFVGVFAGEFLLQNDVPSLFRVMHTLSECAENDPLWSAESGAAAQLENHYETRWSQQTFDQLKQAQPEMKIEHPQRLGFASQQEAEEFFAEGRFFPTGWLRPEVRSMRWVDGFPFSPVEQGATAYALPEVRNFFVPHGRRNITYAGKTAFGDDFLLRGQLDEIYHETAHANDWNTGKYPNDFKIEWYHTMIQRVQAADRDVNGHHEAYLRSPHSSFRNWRAVTEYWANICQKYFTDQERLLVADRGLVESVIRKSDARFDPQTNKREVTAVARRVSMRHIQEMMSREIHRTKDARVRESAMGFWKEIQSRVEKGEYVLSEDIGHLQQQMVSALAVSFSKDSERRLLTHRIDSAVLFYAAYLREEKESQKESSD